MNFLSIILNSWFFNNGGSEFFTWWSNGEPTNFIMTYTVCLAIGIVLAVMIALREAKRLGVAAAHIKGSLIVGLPVFIVASRIVYVASNFAAVTDGLFAWHAFTAMTDIQDGGLNFFGGLVAAVILVFCFTRKNKINGLKILDIMAPAILVLLLFTKIGDFFNYSIFGTAVSADAVSFLPQFIVNRVTVGDLTYQPFYLYEGLWLGVGLIVILMLRRMKTRLEIGDFFGIFLIWYGIGNAFITELFRDSATNLFGIGFNLTLLFPIFLIIGGIVFLVVKHLKFSGQSYFHATNEIRERSLQCYVFDLDQTIIKADRLVNAAYGETLSKAHGLTVYDDPQIALDGERLRRYVQFTKENHELLTETYRGVDYTFSEITKQGGEIVVISKLPADLIAMKILHFGLSKHISRFINSNDIAKLGKQYNPFSIMVFSSDRKILNFSTRNGFKTAYCKFANEDTQGVVADEVLSKFADATFLV